MPPALRDGRAVLLRTRVTVAQLPVPRLIVSTAADSVNNKPGQGYCSRYRACCNLHVWARLNDREPPKLPERPAPKKVALWRALKGVAVGTARALGGMIALGGGVLLDVAWLATLASSGQRPKALRTGRAVAFTGPAS